MSTKKVCGLDLGTGNSCIAVMEGGKPVVIVNSEGKRTTPSVVGFSKEGERKVGDAARRQAVTNPKSTIYHAKRFIGQKYSDLKSEIDRVTFDVKEGQNGVPVMLANDKKLTPQEISAAVIQKMKQTAEDYLGESITDIVITVPAYFNDAQRQATKEAGEIAGLNVLRIINEPTAAALAFGTDKQGKDMRIAVVDIGEGTSDYTALELGEGVYEVLATTGDTHLGGADYDQAIIDYLVSEGKSQFNTDLSKDPMALQRLKEAAEKAKIELSSSASTEVNLPYITVVDNVPQHLVLTLTRAKFEQLSSSLTSRIKKFCDELVTMSKHDKKDFDEILLVGGSTRIPSIQEAIKDYFGKEPNKSVNPDEAVALGAAIQGGVLAGEVEDVLLLDVTPLSLGIETMGGVCTKIIEANTTIPTKQSQVFSTAVDNQPGVEIHVLQGERPMAKDNKSLGIFHLDGIMPARRGVPQIEVTFDIDANGILNVSAVDKGTGKEQKIRIEAGSGLSKEDIEKMKADAELNAEADKKLKENADKINKADSLIFNTEKTLEESGDKLKSETKDKVTKSLNELKEEYNGTKDPEKLDKLSEALLKTMNEAATELYSQANTNTTTENANSSAANQAAEDVEFEEVK